MRYFSDFKTCVFFYELDYLHLYASPNIIVVIKSKRTRWAGHVARIGERSGAYRVLVGQPERKNYLEDLRTRG